GLLDRSGFPEAFATLRPPVVSGPPPEAAKNPAILRAANSTLQIQSRGCGGVLFGSGFPIAGDLVVTNAHVVAGSRRHEVVTNEGLRASAGVVYFEPRHDLALLSVPDLSGAPLPTGARPPRATPRPCCRPPPCRCSRCGWPGRRPGGARRRW